MKLFKIHTKDDVAIVEAKTRQIAFAKYFKEVVENKIPIEKLGNILMLKDNGEEYPIRTLPILWLMGVVDDEQAIQTLIEIEVATSRTEARKLLKKCAEQDRWIAEAIDDLKLLELQKAGDKKKEKQP